MQILCITVCFDSVFVSDYLTVWTWTNKGRSNKHMHIVAAGGAA